jgi:hypothetical protein
MPRASGTRHADPHATRRGALSLEDLRELCAVGGTELLRATLGESWRCFPTPTAPYNGPMARLPPFPVVVVAVVAAVVPLALASCGDGGTSSGPADLSPAVKAKWDAYCAARVACVPGLVCASSACMAAAAEEGPLVEFIDCQNTKMCGIVNDECQEMAGTTDAEREAFIPRCEAALLSYQLMAQSLPDCHIETRLCTLISYPMYRKEIFRAADACLSVPCAELRACLDKAIAPLGCVEP